MILKLLQSEKDKLKSLNIVIFFPKSVDMTRFKKLKLYLFCFSNTIFVLALGIFQILKLIL